MTACPPCGNTCRRRVRRPGPKQQRLLQGTLCGSLLSALCPSCGRRLGQPLYGPLGVCCRNASPVQRQQCSSAVTSANLLLCPTLALCRCHPVYHIVYLLP